MVTIKYAVLRSDNFHKGMAKLAACAMDADSGAKFLDLAKSLEEAIAKSQVEWVGLIKPNCEINGATFKLNEDKTDFAWLPGVEAGLMRAKIMEFANQDLVLENHDKLELVVDCKLSPVELAALDAVVSVKAPS